MRRFWKPPTDVYVYCWQHSTPVRLECDYEFSASKGKYQSVVTCPVCQRVQASYMEAGGYPASAHRTRRAFLWRSLRIGIETRWLELATWEERWNGIEWVPQRWL